MKKNKSIIEIKSTRSVWSLIIFFALATVFSLIEIIGWAIQPDVYGLIVWCCIFLANIAVTALFVEFSKRRIEIDLENEILFCKRLFVKKQSIRLDDVEKVLNAEKKIVWNLKLISGKDGTAFRIPMDILRDNCLPPKRFSDFITEKGTGAEKLDPALLESDSKLQKKSSIIIKAFSAIVCVPIIAAYAIVFAEEMKGRPEFPIKSLALYMYPSFWVLLVFGLLLICMMFSSKKHFQFVDFGAVLIFLMFFPSLICCLLLRPNECYISATRDFENYYEVEADGIDYFPDAIEGGEVMAFSYYYCDYWDWVHEVCLEVKYDDEEFDRIYSEYEEKERSYFGEGLEEVHFDTKYENLELYENDGGEVEIAHASIKLMIFDKENNTVIYYYLSSTDFFELDRCYLIERFDIDIHDYAEYVEEKQNNTN